VIRLLFDLAVIAATAVGLAVLGDHKGMPEGLVYRGGLLLLAERKESL